MSSYGATSERGRTQFRVRAPLASALWLCLFEDEHEEQVAMARDGEDWVADIPRDLAGVAYGYRSEGDWSPEQGKWFDPAKLIIDPYALELDRRFEHSPALAKFGADTGNIVPRALVPGTLPEAPLQAPRFTPGGLVYELNVAGFTALHPEIPETQRGTIAALALPAVLAHLRKLHVSAIELMPIVAWIDERHLPPLGLANHWGYNPVVPMALDPGLCPGGVAELRDTVAVLHAAGIGVILDLVLNHTGESDVQGGVLSLRGLDDSVYGKAPDGTLINDAGCGNTLDFAQPHVRALALETLRHFVLHCGVDGFRFDLAPVLARGPGFDPKAPIFDEIAGDRLLADRVLIAEPWDIGPGGYQLGNFPPHWLEWNDRYRDDVRRFWRGDGPANVLATRMAGSSDIFGPHCRSVNFLAAHDGFTLADTVSYEHRHNFANGEDNRDGHSENFIWNNGVEGPSDNPAMLASRQADQRALLATLFASTGTIMLTAGDECGRSQHGNNNAYCQFVPLEWEGRDLALEEFVASLAAMRAACGEGMAQFSRDGSWTGIGGKPLTEADWNDPALSGFVYLPADTSAALGFEVDRIERRVSIHARN